MEVNSESNISAAKSPWGKVSQPPATASLSEIMSEQLAIDLHSKEVDSYTKSLLSDGNDAAAGFVVESSGCDSDQMIARMLQMQFDKEHDEVVKRTEAKWNGTSKVTVSYNNYLLSGQEEEEDSDYDEDVDDTKRHWDNFEASEAAFPSIPRCGYRRAPEGPGIVTKHDINMANRRNACRVMEFPPEFHTGDGGGFDMKLSNQVFNSLKRHSKVEQGRRARLHDKSELATSEQAVDPRTRIVLHKWIDAGLLENVGGILSTGKEAVILHAEGGKKEDGTELPKYCAIKIFKTTLNEFKDRDKYIRDDHRFKDKFTKQNNRKMIELWAEKELRNLIRMRNAGVKCPSAVHLKKHILVMEMIADSHGPALKLKDAALNAAEVCVAYEQVVETMKILYHKAGLIHADLSEYNILWCEGDCWFIDVGQAIEPRHPGARSFLFRDCTNIATFFRRKGMPNVASPEELFKEVTGFTDDPTKCIEDAVLEQQIAEYERDEELLAHQEPRNHYPFEHCWQKSLAENAAMKEAAALNREPVEIEAKAT
ncbi:serine/threonine-protein kinase RIO3 [Neocloeon triangulifer]|uniref:serine/threonine-protein kinase RIO3 n=1 Tax=Neocloeon triangulifer TaxID=2078957 RepID=UPI00286FAC92|nr:serine/threonine-protein kinase RIO3 [Neocloeon triangulifer]